MRLVDNDGLRMALQMPLRQPGRSALTTLGLAIGVGAFIAMVSFGRGARTSVVSQFETLGSNILRIKTQFGTGSEAPRLLSERDVAALRREGTSLARVVPQAYATMTVSYRDKAARTSVRGTIPDFASAGDWAVAAGGLFDDADMAQRAKVCVIGATPARCSGAPIRSGKSSPSTSACRAA